MYLLTIREGLHTRHIGPYASPKQAADDLDRLLASCGDRARWQIHALEAPDADRSRSRVAGLTDRGAASSSAA